MTAAPTQRRVQGIQLRCAESTWKTLTSHIHQPDGGEHGGALLCGLARRNGRIRLLAQDAVIAEDGTDYVEGVIGHRALTPTFIRRVLRRAEKHQLVPLFVHGHGRGDRVAFSPVDLNSHERGYPALLEITGQIVGALVLATGAVAGDIWFPGGHRLPIDQTVIIGPNVITLTPEPRPTTGHRPDDDRQVRLLGPAGQQLLRAARIGVIGAGGAGMLAIEYLTRLGVGTLVTIDPDRVDFTNLNRLPGATPWDAMAALTAPERPDWIRRVGRRLATRKVNIARRLVRQAGRGTVIETWATDIRDERAAAALTHCDYIVLAADSPAARHLANVIAYQYLIPMIQVGTKIQASPTGDIDTLFAITRPVLPDGGCLECNGLIDHHLLGIDALPPEQRAAADYGTGEPAPSVITLNALAVAEATTYLMLALTGLSESDQIEYIRHLPLTAQRKRSPVVDRQCATCKPGGLLALGDLEPLPLPRSVR